MSPSGWIALLAGVLTLTGGIAVQFLRVQGAAGEDVPFAYALAWSSVITTVVCLVVVGGGFALLGAQDKRREGALEAMYPASKHYFVGKDPEVKRALKSLGATGTGGLRPYFSVDARPDQLECWVGGGTPKLALAVPWSQTISIERGVVQRSWKTVYAIVVDIKTNDGSTKLPLPLCVQGRYAKQLLDGDEFDAAFTEMATARLGQLREDSR